MKIQMRNLLSTLTLLSAMNFQSLTAFAQGTAFTYQGRLNDSGGPANGSYDFQFQLASDPLAKHYVGSPYPTNGITVNGGLFVTTLDFGPSVFAGSNYWLEVDVRTNGAANYTALTPLQALTPTPYAIFANTASNLNGTLPAGQLSGTLLNTSLPASPSFSGTVTANALSGNGTNVTGVNAATLNGLGTTNFWQLGGNNVASGQFLGSINNQPVEFWTGGNRALRLEPNNDNAPNLIGGSANNFVNNGIVGASILGGGGFDASLGNRTNQIAANFSTIAGGSGNSVIAGGNYGYSDIAGGWQNTVGGDFSSIGGGQYNSVGGYGSEIGGGSANLVANDYSVIGGGQNNIITNASFGSSTIAGGAGNQVAAQGGTIAGGLNNLINNNGLIATVGGGYTNIATAYAATVAGGQQNAATGQNSTVGGGDLNQATGDGSVISGGGYNGSNIGNLASGTASTIGGGVGNTNIGNYATIPGGYFNLAGGRFSFAAGFEAQALHDGTFVWADDSQFAPFASTATNQFLIRALGGVGIDTAVTPDSYLCINTNTYLFSHVLYLRGETASDHNHGLAYNGNTVTNFGNGQYQVDGPALWGYAGGLLGTRINGDNAALTWDSSGVTVNGTLSGVGSGLTALNAAQLTIGMLPLAQLPPPVVTNFENGVTLANLTLSGTLNLPATPVTINSGGSLLMDADNSGNFFIGPNAGNLATSGFANTANGDQALFNNTSGSYNTANGNGALYNNKSGSYNTAEGVAALYYLGHNNSAGGTNNIALGYYAGSAFTANESGNIDIGNVGVAGENKTIRLGTPGTQTNAVIAGVVTLANGVQVGANGTTMSMIQSGQAIMPSSSLQATNFIVIFPHAFTSIPKVIASLSGDPGYFNAGDTFAMSIRAITTTAGFTINVFRVDQASGWSQQLRVNWQAWQ